MRPTARILCALAAAALLAGPTAASAQTWPTRPITVISPFTAGNANDMVARVVLDQVSRQVGQPFVIENRPGAGGTIGVNAVARSNPDGYTVLMHSSSFAAAYVMYKNLPYDTLKDFTPVVLFGAQPTVLVTAPSKGFKTLADLVAAAKAKPGSFNFASAGIGSASHMAAVRLIQAAGFKAQHIPFRGPTEAFAEVMSGRVDFYFLPLAPAISVIGAGKVQALAISTDQRLPSLPNVPTLKESGYPDAAYQFWGGLFLPAKTPPAVAAKLHDEAAKALATPDMQAKLGKLGVQPMPMTAAQFAKYFHDDVASTVKLAKEAGIEAH